MSGRSRRPTWPLTARPVNEPAGARGPAQSLDTRPAPTRAGDATWKQNRPRNRPNPPPGIESAGRMTSRCPRRATGSKSQAGGTAGRIFGRTASSALVQTSSRAGSRSRSSRSEGEHMAEARKPRLARGSSRASASRVSQGALNRHIASCGRREAPLDSSVAVSIGAPDSVIVLARGVRRAGLTLCGQTKLPAISGAIAAVPPGWATARLAIGVPQIDFVVASTKGRGRRGALRSLNERA